jgi:hypothetical protein
MNSHKSHSSFYLCSGLRKFRPDCNHPFPKDICIRRRHHILRFHYSSRLICHSSSMDYLLHRCIHKSRHCRSIKIHLGKHLRNYYNFQAYPEARNRHFSPLCQTGRHIRLPHIASLLCIAFHNLRSCPDRSSGRDYGRTGCSRMCRLCSFAHHRNQDQTYNTPV